MADTNYRSWAACMTTWPRSYYWDRAGRASESCSFFLPRPRQGDDDDDEEKNFRG